MKQTVLNQPDVQDWFGRHFHSLAIDVEGDVEIIDFDGNSTTQKAFASRNRVRATPLLAFFDLDGKRVFRYVGAPADKAEFLLMGEYVAEGTYRRSDANGRPIRFTRFKRLQRQEKQ